jgi:leucine dehydrogenase
MSYKNAVAGLQLGGGKSVIIGDPRKDKSEALFRAFGRFVQSLNGRYYTAEDVGTSTADIEHVRVETEYAAGVPVESGGSGDPSPFTSLGVFRGILACAKETWGSDSLEGKTVAVQGVGHVGFGLCELLHEAGAKLIITDIYQDQIDKAVAAFGAQVVGPNEIYGIKCDIFSPNALGAVINDDTIDQLKCEIVAGAANNQLKEDRHGEILQQRGILYAPDYVINGGGVINVADELEPSGYNTARSTAKVMKIYDTVAQVIEISKREHIPTFKAADRLAEDRMEKIAQVRRTYLNY